jgi:hypothetical protein
MTAAAPHALSELPEGETWARRISPALLGFIPVAALGSAQGGYFATSWGWAALCLFWASAVAVVVLPAVRLATGEIAFVLGWVVVAAWISLSVLWSNDVPQTMLDLERVAVYVAGAVALVVFTSSRTVPYLLGGLVCAIGAVSTFSLATRLFPGRIRVFDPTATYRLAQPLGYWNGLSVFCAMGMVLAVGYAARGRSAGVRALAAALLPLLLATFYFTFGRTGWLALAVGLMAAILFDRRRLQLVAIMLLLAPIAAVAVWSSAHYPGLTRRTARLAEATRDGHRLAGILLILVALAAVVSFAFARAERRVQVSPRTRRAFALSTVGLAAVTLLGVFVHFGGPPTLVEKGWRAFKAAPTRTENLNQRLLSFSGNGRYDLWRVAWRDAESHPVLGSGAGSYERYFLQHQPASVSRVRDAHGLYIETLAELGPFGLALLVVALLVPLAVAVRRRLSFTGAAAGAYVVLLVHAGTDWDWELPAVTLAGLLCAGALVVGDRRSGRPVGGAWSRGVVVAAVVAAGALVGVGLLGNSALGSADSALKAGAWRDAAADANRARTWMPWSPHPWVALGRAQLGAGSPAAARASFEKAVSMDSGDWALWVDLARATHGAEQRHALREALALYPRAGFRLSPTGEITGGDTTP